MTIKTKSQLLTMGLSFGGVPFADILAKDAADTQGSMGLSFGGVPFFGAVSGSVTTDIAPGEGNLLIVGYAPTVTQGTAINLFPTGGTLQIVGYAPEVSQTSFHRDWIFVLEIHIPVTTSSPSAQTFYYSERAMITGASSTPPNYLFRELVLDPGSCKRDIPLSQRAMGLITSLFGSARLVNTDGTFDEWIDFGTHGGVVVCRWGPWRGVYPDDFFHMYTARIEGNPIIGFDDMELNLIGDSFIFDKPVITEGFDGSGDLEGTGAAGNARKMRVLGTCYETPILVDEVDNAYYLTAGTGLTGTPILFNGGNPLTYSGDFSLAGSPAPNSVPGTFLTRYTSKGLYAYLGAVPDVDLRAYVSGESWDILDLASAAGLDLSQTNVTAGIISGVFDCGNRIIDTQTFAQVFTDIAKYEYGVIGFDRLNRFFSRMVLPSTYFDGTGGFTFTENNSRNWKVIPGLGNGRRVWRLNVKSFPHKKSRLVGTVADNSYLDDPAFTAAQRAIITQHKPNLLRDPYKTQFTASSVTVHSWANLVFSVNSVLQADPGAEELNITLDSDNFATEADMQTYGDRVLRVAGAKQFAMSLETDLTPSTASLELLDKVDVQTTRFNSSQRTLRIAGITLNLNKRTVEFVLFGQADVPTDVELTYSDFDPNAASNGANVGVNVNTGVGDGRDFSIPLGNEVDFITAGLEKRTWFAPFDFQLEEVCGFLKVPQSSGAIYTVDILADGISIFTGVAGGSPTVPPVGSPTPQKLTIDNGDSSSITATVPCTLTTTFLPKGTKCTFNIDQIGDGTAIGPSVSLTGFRVYNQ